MISGSSSSPKRQRYASQAQAGYSRVVKRRARAFSAHLEFPKKPLMKESFGRKIIDASGKIKTILPALNT
ncbi:MAG: hypothetical protein L0G27_00535 [Paracoccus sp. (in: a-proteobacteria)]|nr:hypothetical protein [Paracoccus sp. (in: a-proteobacteria)]